jgi:hypothetical protein
VSGNVLSKTKSSRECRNGHDLSLPEALIASPDGYHRCRECRRLNNQAKRRRARQTEHVDGELLVRYVRKILPRYGTWERIANATGVRKNVYYLALDGKEITLHNLDTVVTRTGGVLFIEAPEVYPEL